MLVALRTSRVTRVTSCYLTNSAPVLQNGRGLKSLEFQTRCHLSRAVSAKRLLACPSQPEWQYSDISKKGQSPQQRHRVCASLSTEPGRAELIAVLSGGQNCLLHSPEEQSPQIGRVAEKPVQVGPSGSREFARSAYRRSIPPPIGFAQPRFTERDYSGFRSN